MIPLRAKSFASGGNVLDNADPARMAISRNWSGVNERSDKMRPLSIKVND